MCASTPKISVIIPVYNDSKGLQDTLESVVGQDFPDERYEVLPVDNNSTDNTGDVIEEFEEDYPGLVRGLEENEIQGSYAARNKGIEEAEGEILVFTDADMWWDDDVLSVVEREFSETDVDYLGGQIESVKSDDSVYSVLGMKEFQVTEKKLQEQNYVPTAFVAVRKEAVEAVDGFDARMYSSGDKVFGKQIHESGFKQGFSEEIKTYHPTRTSFRSMVKRRIRFGGGNYSLLKYYPEMELDRHPVSLRNFFPTLPSRLDDILEDWKKLSLTDKARVYFTYWACKVARPYGFTKAYLLDKINS